ncbi:MAG: PASTA domain-containing protein [Bacteroidetes bacterium]|nr:PASTA domain-containing protein [Bacteroidota bacterium]
MMKTLDVRYRDSALNNDYVRLYASNYQPVLNKEIVSKQSVPDVKGMGLKDALYLLETMNMKVDVKGKGKVKSQSLQPGTTLTKNQAITLQLD